MYPRTKGKKNEQNFFKEPTSSTGTRFVTVKSKPTNLLETN